MTAAHWDSSRYVLIDSNVASFFVKTRRQPEHDYAHLIDGRFICLAPQTVGELRRLQTGDAPRRSEAVGRFIEACFQLPMTSITPSHYAAVESADDAPTTGAGQNDKWIIAFAIETGLELMSHDGGLLTLAERLGVATLTLLPVPSP